MQTAVTINEQSMQIKTYKGNRVVTFRDIDLVHGRPKGTARKRFNDNKKHFIEGEDFYKLSASEIRTHNISGVSDKRYQDVVFLTESGYLMLVKSFTDDLAWDVQRQLVKSYFRAKETDLVSAQYNYFDKTYKGQPVMTISDIVYFSGLTKGVIAKQILKLKLGTDYFNLKNDDLAIFRRENPKMFPVPHLIIVTRSGFMKLAKLLKIKIETPQLFIEAPKPKKTSKLEDNATFSETLTELLETLTALKVAAKLRSNAKENEAVDKFGYNVEHLGYQACILSYKLANNYKN